MKLAIAGDSAGEGLAKVLADHLKDRFDVHEVSRTAYRRRSLLRKPVGPRRLGRHRRNL
jgi:ribose 5-phosphate isomerase RpiB